MNPDDDPKDDAAVLQLLVDADGAILHWQAPSALAESFLSALRRGVVDFDEDTDCYVHPAATRIGNGAYTIYRR